MACGTVDILAKNKTASSRSGLLSVSQTSAENQLGYSRESKIPSKSRIDMKMLNKSRYRLSVAMT